eukprot:scpid89864/ scgid21284/ 
MAREFYVKNVRGTSEQHYLKTLTVEKSSCRSWIAYWRAANGGRKFTESPTCSVSGCTVNDKKSIHGGHVIFTPDSRSKGEGRYWWIIPLCARHNHYTNDEEMGVTVEAHDHRVRVNVPPGEKPITCKK